MSVPYLAQIAVMVIWTFMVCTKAGIDRVREVRQRRLPLHSIARPADVAQVLQHTQSMDNFNNLMQMPVLFYVLCLMLTVMQRQSVWYQLSLWCYVVLRITHSLIQITHNHVLYRFRCWMASTMVLAMAWAMLIFQQVFISVRSLP